MLFFGWGAVFQLLVYSVGYPPFFLLDGSVFQFMFSPSLPPPPPIILHKYTLCSELLIVLAPRGVVMSKNVGSTHGERRAMGSVDRAPNLDMGVSGRSRP